MVVPDRPLETFAVGCEFAAAVSQAVCACGALSRNIPIYRYVAKLARPTVSLSHNEGKKSIIGLLKYTNLE